MFHASLWYGSNGVRVVSNNSCTGQELRMAKSVD
jgi:hypothetical protein